MMAASQNIKVSLSVLLEGVDVIGALPDIEVSGVAMDSRQLAEGDVFLACAGYRSHGLDYLQQAFDAGVKIILADVTSEWLPQKIEALSEKSPVPVIAVSGLGESASLIAGRFYGNPSHELSVIGITGTNGKTSCSQFIANAFEGKRKVAVLGTLGNGFPGDLIPSTHTTMDPVSVQAALALLKIQHAEMVAMEVSSHALQQGRVADVRFDMAVLTNFSRDHLDYHGTMADYASAKSLLFKMPALKSVLINADDELGKRLVDELATSPVRIVAYGESVGRGTDVSAVDAWIGIESVRALPHGLLFTVVSSWGEADVELSLMGRFNVSNAVVALGVMLECGVDFREAINNLALLKTVNGRMEMFSADGGPAVVVDFAHTPDALQQALQSLRDHTSGKLVCVFGCGGERDKGKRPQMGKIAEQLADEVILTDDNPRHEDSVLIIKDILNGMSASEAVHVEQNRAKAIRMAIKRAGKGDVVLVAGKGHESYQVVGDLKLSFSDQQVVQTVLEEL